MEQHQQVAGLPPPFAVNSADAQPSAVANPTPTQPQLAPTHPSYAEMITAAILWDSSQGKAGGSSKRAIAKYIDRVYTNLPPTHSALLTHHLKRLKNSGQLVMIKNSYQLPVVAAAAAAASAAVPLRSAPPSQSQPQSQDSTIPKKRPGRPPKAKTLGQPSSGSVGPSPPPAAGVGNGPSTGKRPRGRPPRQQQQQQPAVAEVPFVQPVYDAPPDVGLNNGQPVKRRPGRPFKNKPAQPIYQAQAQAQFQPAKQELAIVPVNGTVSGVPKKRPGRPPKAKGVAAPGIAAGGSGKPRGRPKRSALAPVAKPVGKKPRGRPPRQAGVAPGSGVAGGKRRGRPPRGSVPTPKPVRKYAGKPRGRPRKNTSLVGKQTSEQVAANEELMKKVENMQATIKDAVGVLRSFVPNEDGSDALAALQQLEHLSTMSLTGSPSLTPEEPPMTTTYVNSTVQVQPSTSVPETESITVSTMVPPVVPFSIAEPTMNEMAPLYGPPPTIEAEQPVSWIPSSEAQL